MLTSISLQHSKCINVSDVKTVISSHSVGNFCSFFCTFSTKTLKFCTLKLAGVCTHGLINVRSFPSPPSASQTEHPSEFFPSLFFLISAENMEFTGKKGARRHTERRVSAQMGQGTHKIHSLAGCVSWFSFFFSIVFHLFSGLLDTKGWG